MMPRGFRHSCHIKAKTFQQLTGGQDRTGSPFASQLRHRQKLPNAVFASVSPGAHGNEPVLDEHRERTIKKSGAKSLVAVIVDGTVVVVKTVGKGASKLVPWAGAVFVATDLAAAQGVYDEVDAFLPLPIAGWGSDLLGAKRGY